jgi:acetoin utilization protein AcuB
MLVRDWMHRPVETIKPRDSIEHARAVIETHRVNQLPVVVGHDVVGIVTDRDLRDAYPSVFEIASSGGVPGRDLPDPSQILVEAVMVSNVLTISPEEDVTAAADLMRRERIGALPVVENGGLIGILTRSDLLTAFIDILRRSEVPGGGAGAARKKAR